MQINLTGFLESKVRSVELCVVQLWLISFAISSDRRIHAISLEVIVIRTIFHWRCSQGVCGREERGASEKTDG